jgi:hypothetical protein
VILRAGEATTEDAEHTEGRAIFAVSVRPCVHEVEIATEGTPRTPKKAVYVGSAFGGFGVFGALTAGVGAFGVFGSG